MRISLGIITIGFLPLIAVSASRVDRSAPVNLGERSHRIGHMETPVDPPSHPIAKKPSPAIAGGGPYVRDSFVSVQVNVDAFGNNIPGDAANEPSIAVDTTAPGNMVIGWRQFDTVSSNFRQSGYAHSHDGGQTWTNPGVLEPGVFSSDPVLDADADGRIFYYALQPQRGPGEWACYMYRTADGGVTWPQERFAFGGDKAWITIDRTDGPGRGNIYSAWSHFAGCCGLSVFNRSTDGGLTFSNPITIPQTPRWGTLTVAPNGWLYVVGGTGDDSFIVAGSRDAQDPNRNPLFNHVASVDLGGSITSGIGPNPGGLLGQIWIASDHSDGPRRGHLYVLASVNPPGSDPLDVMFTRSTDGGTTWSPPVRVNDDAIDNGAWQWFATMSVAPNGRIDVIFNDTRNDGSGTFSELHYTQSTDGGLTFSTNIPVSNPFNHFLGYPRQDKLGDYYDMVSDESGANVAYAATFNGEQDVYFLRIGDLDCNGNGLPDADDIADGRSDDCDGNLLPDECDRDCDENETSDVCDILFDGASDCDGNVVPDQCDPNFDGDALIDGCDPDIDNDGVVNGSDVCDFTPFGVFVLADGRPFGDADTSCATDRGDIRPFTECLVPSGPLWPTTRSCGNLFDDDGDGDIDLADAARFYREFTGP